MKAIAIHLPQFHPFPENDAWWGKGFTEWTNVAKATPRFKGHYQPHLPADLGFYDLRLEEARIAQAELAKAYGISGFCYYHYWFNGKRLLQRPLDDMLKTQTPDFPFMLCWANENWTRRWDGLNNEILIKQDYSLEDDLNHIHFLCERFFSDDRYIKVQGKPFFVIYRPGLFPDIKRTIDIWRNAALKNGIGELYLGYMQAFGLKAPPTDIGFDCAIQFHPDFHSFPIKKNVPMIDRILQKFRIKESIHMANTIIDYEQYVKWALGQPLNENVYPGITPMWDNTSRKKQDAYILQGSTPDLFERWFTGVYKNYEQSPEQNKFIFINAWNEWAEGNHLEPCQKWGHEYLHAVARVVKSVERS